MSGLNISHIIDKFLDENTHLWLFEPADNTTRLVIELQLENYLNMLGIEFSEIDIHLSPNEIYVAVYGDEIDYLGITKEVMIKEI